jgi:hypothetical protein
MRQAWGAKETLRALTSPGKTTVRQETYRQGWLALEIWTHVLALPLGVPSQHKGTLEDTQLVPQAWWAYPQSRPLGKLLSSSITHWILTAGPNITSLQSPFAPSRQSAVFFCYCPLH